MDFLYLVKEQQCFTYRYLRFVLLFDIIQYSVNIEVSE